MTAAFNTAIRNAHMDAITTQAGASAKLRIYNGTRPASGAALSGNTLLAEIVLNATFAPAASGGAITLNAAAGAATAAASGTATWARLVKSDGTTWVADLDVGTDISVTPTSITSGAQVSLNSGGTFTSGNA